LSGLGARKCGFALVCKDGNGVRVEGDSTIRVRFRILFDESAWKFDHVALNGESGAFEVDIASAKRADLTTSCTSRRSHVEEVRQFWVTDVSCSQQLIDLFGVGWGRFGLSQAGRCRVGREVTAHPSPQDRLAEGPADDRVDLADRSRG
jgi:hypothetical protein